MFTLGGEAGWFVIAGATLTWIIVILGVAELARFYKRFVQTSKDLDANLLAISAHLKRMQSTMSELSIEQRRATRLMLEQIELKKAELTGDFEVVEEPIAAEEKAPPPVRPGIKLEE